MITSLRQAACQDFFIDYWNRQSIPVVSIIVQYAGATGPKITEVARSCLTTLLQVEHHIGQKPATELAAKIKALNAAFDEMEKLDLLALFPQKVFDFSADLRSVPIPFFRLVPSFVGVSNFGSKTMRDACIELCRVINTLGDKISIDHVIKTLEEMYGKPIEQLINIFVKDFIAPCLSHFPNNLDALIKELDSAIKKWTPVLCGQPWTNTPQQNKSDLALFEAVNKRADLLSSAEHPPIMLGLLPQGVNPPSSFGDGQDFYAFVAQQSPLLGHLLDLGRRFLDTTNYFPHIHQVYIVGDRHAVAIPNELNFTPPQNTTYTCESLIELGMRMLRLDVKSGQVISAAKIVTGMNMNDTSIVLKSHWAQLFSTWQDFAENADVEETAFTMRSRQVYDRVKRAVPSLPKVVGPFGDVIDDFIKVLLGPLLAGIKPSRFHETYKKVVLPLSVNLIAAFLKNYVRERSESDKELTVGNLIEETLALIADFFVEVKAGFDPYLPPTTTTTTTTTTSRK